MRVDISLVSHTNAGKTTLARTLLRRDIGEVGDRAHLTEQATSGVLIETPLGDSLVLWDTPGFGDSVRLLKRLKQADGALGWFLTRVWDRLVDRPFWCGQQAVRNVRDVSDVILYVVNASESPAAAGYVDAEMQILGWLRKPVIVLLNQTGRPRDAEEAQREVAQWQPHAERHPCIGQLLAFDAFARCWVQEGTLLEHIQRLLPAVKRAAFGNIQAAWRLRSLTVFHQSMRVLATSIAALAADCEPTATPNIHSRARAWLAATAGAMIGSDPGRVELDRAQKALANRADARSQAALVELARLHELSGATQNDVMQLIGNEYAVSRAADAGTAGVLGGVVSGALGGLAADLGAGGLTFGAGAIIGGVLGAFGAHGLAKAYNLARGTDAGTVRWSARFVADRLAAALMTYLAVAHFGRGRGEFVAGASPLHWRNAVLEALAAQESKLNTALAEEAASGDIVAVMTGCARAVLTQLYPESAAVWQGADPQSKGER